MFSIAGKVNHPYGMERGKCAKERFKTRESANSGELMEKRYSGGLGKSRVILQPQA